jgi:hypothetical protein
VATCAVLGMLLLFAPDPCEREARGGYAMATMSAYLDRTREA